MSGEGITNPASTAELKERLDTLEAGQANRVISVEQDGLKKVKRINYDPTIEKLIVVHKGS